MLGGVQGREPGTPRRFPNLGAMCRKGPVPQHAPPFPGDALQSLRPPTVRCHLSCGRDVRAQRRDSGFRPLSDTHSDVVSAKVAAPAERDRTGSLELTSIPTWMVFRERALRYSRPAALPAASRQDLIGQVRALDIDEVSRQVAVAKEKRTAWSSHLGRRPWCATREASRRLPCRRWDCSPGGTCSRASTSSRSSRNFSHMKPSCRP